ncbi:Hypothetical predicted protein [Paramuricea clavata]|uniref:Uncharacterized protein n=1 Tax=Paramuricea clavata TaxID=317549 RepID=A0A6S7IZT8_PARCT|nr:Hypothetical predicted protein [Paramuricea clavata]
MWNILSDDPVESDDEDDGQEFVLTKTIKKKTGRRTKWTEEMLNDFIDIIVSSEYYKKKLIFMNTKTQRNGEMYEAILKQLEKRCVKRGEKVPFTAQQLTSKFKKCVGMCKQAALTIKSATEIAIEPSALGNTSGNSTEEVGDSDIMESEDTATKGSDEHEGKDKLFIPIKPNKTKKKEDVAVEALQVLNKVVERDHTKELIDFMKDQMEKSQEHELKVLKMNISSESIPQPRNVHPRGIESVYQQPHMPTHCHWNSGSTFQSNLQPSPNQSRPSSSLSSSSSLSFNNTEPMAHEQEPTYHSL